MFGRTLDGAQRMDGETGGTAGLGAAPASHAIAGNVYRIVQTNEPDGKKLLKLLPVSKTLGNAEPSVHAPVVSDITKVDASVSGLVSLKTAFSNITSPLVKVPTLLTGSPGTLILRKKLDKVELVKVNPVVNENPSITAIQNNYVSVDKLSLQNDAASISSVKSNLLMNTKNLPVVNSSVLPSGHYLQIPAYAEVKSVPASCLHPAIQQKILAVAATNASVTPEAAKPPNVIYVSPVKAVKTPISECLQNKNPTPAAEIAEPLVLTSVQTAVSNSVPDAVSHNSQNPREIPMKWVVQENPQSSASCLVPVRSSNDMVSKMLKALADKKNVKNNPASTLPSSSSSLSESQAKWSSVKDNALVMYNGQVYLLRRKGSSTESAPVDKQVSTTADTHFRKHTSQVTSSVANNTITNQVVNLVLSKNKGVVLNAKDSKSCENAKPSLWSELNKTVKVTPVLSTSHGNRQIVSINQKEAMPASENTPVGIKVDDKTVTGDLNINIIQKTLSSKTVALQASTFDASKEEQQKIEKINSTGLVVQIQQRKVQRVEQYTEIRKKFGLLKEERVYLRRLPLLNSIKTEETKCSSNIHTNDSCKLLQAITVKPDPEEEEMIFEKQEADIKRKAELPEPVLENAKRRKTLGLRLDHDDSSSVTDNPGSSCRQVISHQEDPIVSLQFSSSGDSDINSCMQSNEDREILCPTLHNIKTETSFSEGSLGEDHCLFSPPDLEETIKDEKIEQLKLLLKKQEAALEEMRKNLQET